MTAPTPFAVQPTLESPLHLEALSMMHRIPGPALTGRTVVRVVVNVTASDGTPLTGLSQAAFDAQVVAGSGAGRHAHLPVGGVEEAVPGIYTLSFGESGGGSAHESQMLAVFVHDPVSSREGRTLVRVER